MKVENKNVLVIVPKYYGYEDYIVDALKKRGALDVFVIYENMDAISMIYRMAYVYFKRIKWRLLNHYYFKRIKGINQIDIVFAIRASSLSKLVITEIKKKNPKCYFIMYQWDSVSNNQNAVTIAEYFDEIYTFDRGDAKKYGWVYRPLFFISGLCKRNEKKVYDIALISILHSNRAFIYRKIVTVCKRNNINLFAYLYSIRLVYLRHKYILRDKELRYVKLNDVHFKSLTLEETHDVYNKCKVIIDYTHPDQRGLTMRTIESVGHGCKLITNNEEVKLEPFYNPQNVIIYSGEEINVLKRFLEMNYQEIGDDLYQYYSLEGWIDTMFHE